MARRDLTTTRISRGIIALAVPMVGANVLQSVQTMVDMYFVGGLGPEALAAVGMSGTIIMVLITVFMGIHSATVAMIARAVGAGEEGRAEHVCGQAVLLTILFSAVVSVAGFAIAPWLLRALNAEPGVVSLGTGYLHVTFAGMFFLVSTFVLNGVLTGAGDAVTPMMLGALATVVNCVLNPIMIRGYLGFPALGVSGSALATVVARTIALGVGVWMLTRGQLRVTPGLRDLVPALRTVRRFIVIGAPGSLQMSTRMLMNLALVAIVATFGTAAVAAYTVGVRLRMIGFMPLFGLAKASSAMVGQNLGAGRPDRAEQSAWVALGYGLLAATVGAVFFFALAPHLVAFFNDAPEVVAIGTTFLRVTAVGLVAAAVGIVLSMAMNGAGDTLSPLVITIAVLWGFQMPCAIYLAGVSELWGVAIPFRDVFAFVSFGSETGIWVAMVVSAVIQAVAMAAWFSTGHWKKARVD